MKRIEKLLEGIKPVLPDATEETVKHIFGECEGCPITKYCDEYFYYKENGEFVTDESGDRIVNYDMDCDIIVDKWLNEEYDNRGRET